MMAKAKQKDSILTFNCPACANEKIVWGDGEAHQAIPFHQVNVGPGGWGFNGDYQSPTLTPSVRTRYGDKLDYVCHFFVRSGKIHYCQDSTHKLAGQIVDMSDIEADQDES